MNDKSEIIEQDLDKEDTKPVNERGGFCFSTSIKIFDPNTEEVILQIRGDE